MADGERPAIPAPDAAVLQDLPPDQWAVLLRHARAALHRLDEHRLTARMVQLRAAPTGRLAGGRSRRDLCRLLAGGGALWREAASGLQRDPEARDLVAVLRGEADPRTAPQPGPAEPAPDTALRRDQRLRGRHRELVDERDAARRRVAGLQARLQAEHERAAELERELAEATRERDDLRARMEQARSAQDQAVERARRHREAELAEARRQLRALRRREEERRLRRQRRQEARRAAEQREADQTAARRKGRRGGVRRATPGRPSRLPPGVAPGTLEAAQALLAPGRRVLVDGYNVTRQHRDHLPLEQQRAWLAARLATLAARTRVRPTVVFDGDASTGTHLASARKVRLEFTAGGTADDAIVAVVASLPPDEPVVVVTDDRELAERVARLGADLVATRTLLQLG
ncbi:MAG TPA: NYN domain-containing protein [Nitriliruptorales bacterium]|nr:NYN domain-containing protein [Nitriliruptorales bacterium]